MTLRLRSVVLVAVLVVAVLPLPRSSATPLAAAPACPTFPADNVWRADVSKLPVHARSAAWLTSMGGATRRLHPDFGPSGLERPYGIPYEVVPGSHAKVRVSFDYTDESDAGPYPIDSATPIEMGSDAHALMLDKDTCKLYELFAVEKTSSGWHAGSGAIFDMRTNSLRPAGWTSADAAGLPIFSGLVRLDEVKNGLVDHAIRVTASRTDKRYVWPARHQAGYAADQNLPPMGARFRLKAGFDISGFRADTQVVLRAFKKHGLILADNGSNWYFQGTSESGWPTAMLDELKSITAGNFEAVDVSSLMTDPASARVRSKGVRLHAIVFNPAGDDVAGEAIVLRNDTGSSVALTGWTIVDAAGNRYTFGSYSLGARSKVTIRTGAGTNTTTTRYWGRTRPVWNNTGDSARLRNRSGTQIDYCRYYNVGRSVMC